MKLSFVIPAYNEELCLPACLRSILAQTATAPCAVEIIVVNNASSDGTKEVASSFAGVTVVDEPRKGLTYARRAGFLKSSGELVANVDADAILPHGWIQTVVEEFSRQQDLAALSGPYVYYDLPILVNMLVRVYYYLGYLGYLVNRFVLRVGSLLQGGNFVVKRAALEKIGGFNTAFSFYGEDADLARRMLKVGAVVFTFRLPMYSSGRRLRAEGIAKMGWKYPLNYFWTLFFKRPFSTSHTDVRAASAAPVFKTTLVALQQHLLLSKLIVALLLVFCSWSIFYASVQIKQLTYPSVAQARQSSSFLVRNFGPSVIKISQSLSRLEADTDDTKQ